MNIQIVQAHLGQYKAVRENITDCLKDFISDTENPLEDRWLMFKEYNELTFQSSIRESTYPPLQDNEKEHYITEVLKMKR